MAKNIIEDVRPPRSIRDIPVPDSRKRKISDDNTSNRVEESDPIADLRRDFREPPLPQRSRETSSKSPRYILWGIVVVCLAILFFAVSVLFTKATVTVTPKTAPAAVDTSLFAVESVQASSTADSATQATTEIGDIQYQVITLNAAASTTVTAQGQQMESQKASGQIVVYNNYSTSPVKLITNTRFETSSGLIYRITSPLTIPGKKGTTPGSVTVTVYADQPGANYNIGLSDFTIPGFENDQTEFNDVFARSKTPMTGGIQGMVSIITPTEQAAAKSTLDSQLAQQLLAQAKSQTPGGFVLFDGGATTTYQSIPNTTVSANQASVQESATLNAFIFNSADLSAALAQKVLPDYDGKPVEISDMNDLQLSDTDKNAWQETNTTIIFTGSVNFVWTYSQDDLKNALKGKSENDISTILENFPAIDKADVVIRPFWVSTFPNDVNKISIVTPPLTQ